MIIIPLEYAYMLVVTSYCASWSWWSNICSQKRYECRSWSDAERARL